MPEDLVHKARAGNKEAMNMLINRHRDLAFSVAFKYLQNREDAEDVTQNAFISVFRSIRDFRSEAKFSTWLYKIVFNECQKEFKKRNTIKFIPELMEVAEEPEVPEDFQYLAINDLLESLKPNEYTVIHLFYLKEKNIQEISTITGLSKANVKVLLHRARKKLQSSETQITPA